MFIYGHSDPKIRLTTKRLVVRLVDERDAYRLADYYTQNREFLQPWEPVRDQSHCYPYGWQARLNLIRELQRQGSGYYFILLDHDEDEVRGIANFSNVLRGAFYACYLGYSLGERWQGQGIMYEGLKACIQYIFRQQKIHRIMANYMPHNHRSGSLLKRLGFTQEGYAEKYLLINGKWQDHILMSLLNAEWMAPG